MARVSPRSATEHGDDEIMTQDHKQPGESARSPKPAEEQEYPEPERLLNVQEERGESIQELEHPPKAEGDREDAEDSLRRQGGE